MLSHFSCVRLFATVRTIARQAPLSMGILQARILEWVAMPSSTVQYRNVKENSKDTNQPYKTGF